MTQLKENDFIKLSSESDLNNIIHINHEINGYGYTVGSLEDLNKDIHEIENNGFSYDITDCYRFNDTYIFFNE